MVSKIINLELERRKAMQKTSESLGLQQEAEVKTQKELLRLQTIWKLGKSTIDEIQEFFQLTAKYPEVDLTFVR